MGSARPFHFSVAAARADLAQTAEVAVYFQASLAEKVSSAPGGSL